MKYTPETIWQLERRLAQPTFRGVPVGASLASLLYLGIYRGGEIGRMETAKAMARFVYHRYHPKTTAPADVSVCRGRILVVWLSPHPRIRELVLPVAHHLGNDRSVFLYKRPEMAAMLPRGARGLGFEAARAYDIAAWRHDFRPFWADFRRVIRDAVRDLELRRGTAQRLADASVCATQQIAGYLEFLSRAAPAAILVEFDRVELAAPLVLAAKTLGIPTYSLLHGMPGPRCLHFQPLLADTLFCWGEMFVELFAAEGVSRQRLLVTGCPRLTRELSISRAAARERMGLAGDKPVVLLATQNFATRASRRKLAETFCAAMAAGERFAGVVRLHPVDALTNYAELQARYPQIRFTVNEQYDLDTVLAAADVVVVHSSGFGGDALTKGRLVVVFDVVDDPLGPGQWLIDDGDVPHATSAESLRAILEGLLFDDDQRRRRQASGERYVQRFCACFGDEAAERTAQAVLQGLAAKDVLPQPAPTV